MEFSDSLKMVINKLQFNVAKDSHVRLLIFDNSYLLNKCLKTLDRVELYERCITISQLCYQKNIFDGLKFSSYWFMTDKDIDEICETLRSNKDERK